MNIIEYSIRLGKALNKTELGKEIKNIYAATEGRAGVSLPT